jgi:hypothetical protein
VGIGSDSAATVDLLLVAVHALRFGDDSVEVSANVSANASANTSANLSPETSSSRPATPSAPPVATAVIQVRPPAPRGFRLGALAGVHSELWQGSIAGAIEGQLGLRLSLRGRWSLAVAGGLGRGMETAESIRARTMHAVVSVGYISGSHLELRLGGEWRVLDAELPGAVPATTRGMTGGLFTSIQYVASRGPFWLFVGPQLGYSASSIVVQISGREIFNIPQLLAGFSVSGEGDFIY